MTNKEKEKIKKEYIKLSSEYIDHLLDGDVVGCTKIMNDMANVIPNNLLDELNMICMKNEEEICSNIEYCTKNIDQRLENMGRVNFLLYSISKNK